MKRWAFFLLVGLALGAVLIIVCFYRIKIYALEEPGYLETALANRAKHLLVHRSSRDGIPAALANLQASIEEEDE